MFVPLSKVLWFLGTPSNGLVGLVLIGFLAISLGWRRLGWWLGLGATLSLVAIGLGPLGTLALLPLEERFAPYREDGQPVAGIIVLGGGVASFLTAARHQLVTGEAGERLLALSDLARRHPEAALVYSGGSAAPRDALDVPEADLVLEYAGTLGLAPGRLRVENRSRTTWENAVETRRLVDPVPGARWLLVTSAWHMPRAVAVFRRADFQVVPYPVDYLTRGPDDALVLNVAIPTGLQRFDVAAKEWVGLLAYYLSGRTAALLPSPDASGAAAPSPTPPSLPASSGMRIR